MNEEKEVIYDKLKLVIVHLILNHISKNISGKSLPWNLGRGFWHQINSTFSFSSVAWSTDTGGWWETCQRCQTLRIFSRIIEVIWLSILVWLKPVTIYLLNEDIKSSLRDMVGFSQNRIKRSHPENCRAGGRNTPRNNRSEPLQFVLPLCTSLQIVLTNTIHSFTVTLQLWFWHVEERRQLNSCT